MFARNLSYIRPFAHKAEEHLKVCPWFLTNEITSVGLLYNFGQGVRKEGYDLITHKSKMIKQDKLSPYAAVDDH